MPEFATDPPIPYVPISEQAVAVRSAIDAARLSNDNSFGGLQRLAIPGPFASDAEANTNGVPDDNLYYRSDGTVRAASHLSLDLAFALDKTLTARIGPTPTFTRASTATFVGSNGLIQSAAIDTPRFDHDPSTGACKGLLIEESRSNLLLRSEEFGTTWSPTNTTVSPNQTVSPDGQTTADKLVEDLALGVHQLTQAFIPVSGTTYTASVFVKAAGRGFAFVGFVGGSMPTTFVSIDLSTGAVTTAIGTPIASSSTSMGDGWWRVSITLASTGTLSSNFDIRTSINGNWADRSYLGDGTSGIFLWGAQLEAGAFPTSYIPTAATVPVVRSADVCSITGGDFSGFYNPSEGSFYVKSFISAQSAATDPFFLSFYSPSLNEWGPRIFSSKVQITQRDGLQKDINAANFVVGSVSAAATYNSLGSAASAYGLPAVGALAPNFIGFNALDIGRRRGGAFYTNGHIASIRYYRKRLTNAKLQALTAP
jgi:hypothetical protein